MTGLWSRFAKNGGAVLGLFVLLLVIAVAVLAPWLFPGSPWDTGAAPFLKPLEEPGVWLGSDSMGRDIAAGIAHGARASLLVGCAATVVAVSIGLLVGVPAGFLGGRYDEALMRLTEIFQTIPSFFLAILFVAIFQPSINSVVAAVGLVSWPPIARLVRAEFMRLKSSEFVEAALVQGLSKTRVVVVEILPNCLSPLIVMASLMVANAILLESALSFLGLGDPNLMSWGYMVGASRSLLRLAWWMCLFPGLAIFMTVLAVNLVGEGLNDALNPKLHRKEG
ncbi:ABC transporter permease [Paenalcaligenes niemegkensis]|uniref:ABC transporter permease n=1 Tax=Paenalcaligenes niemegkensis TaxID=2895469 RepID=UPI001EE79718|nr:ABC transporter permease [Paenalcaligenes niemegkensis]MCQ9618148.1 ABC transporter permease [Paenalcaligenes niemegkensis]